MQVNAGLNLSICLIVKIVRCLKRGGVAPHILDLSVNFRLAIIVYPSRCQLNKKLGGVQFGLHEVAERYTYIPVSVKNRTLIVCPD
jgi:hypothetical protein